MTFWRGTKPKTVPVSVPEAMAHSTKITQRHAPVFSTLMSGSAIFLCGRQGSHSAPDLLTRCWPLTKGEVYVWARFKPEARWCGRATTHPIGLVYLLTCKRFGVRKCVLVNKSRFTRDKRRCVSVWTEPELLKKPQPTRQNAKPTSRCRGGVVVGICEPRVNRSRLESKWFGS